MLEEIFYIIGAVCARLLLGVVIVVCVVCLASWFAAVLR